MVTSIEVADRRSPVSALGAEGAPDEHYNRLARGADLNVLFFPNSVFSPSGVPVPSPLTLAMVSLRAIWSSKYGRVS